MYQIISAAKNDLTASGGPAPASPVLSVQKPAAACLAAGKAVAMEAELVADGTACASCCALAACTACKAGTAGFESCCRYVMAAGNRKATSSFLAGGVSLFPTRHQHPSGNPPIRDPEMVKGTISERLQTHSAERKPLEKARLSAAALSGG